MGLVEAKLYRSVEEIERVNEKKFTYFEVLAVLD